MLNKTTFKLENKVAIITGASKGIGKSISKKLSDFGCKVAMIGRNKEDLDSAKKEIKSKQAMIFKCDVLDKNEFKNVTQKIYEKWGKIDILINNAGINRDKLLLRLSDVDWDDVININLKGIFNTTQIVSRYMLKERYGKIINISSVIGQIGNSGQSNYAASKAGIDGMTRALAVEFGAKNININAIAPGFINTEMTKNINEKKQKEMLDSIPLNKFGSANDVANLACYLSSDLSDYITGQIINVDGGMTIK